MRIQSYMVRPVSLSDPAFAALRREKRASESDSDVVLRLLREAKARRKDPRAFLRYAARPVESWDEHERAVERMRRADRRDPWG